MSKTISLDELPRKAERLLRAAWEEHEGGEGCETYDCWCREPDSNRHGSHEPGDFKSPASANSATPAGCSERALF